MSKTLAIFILFIGFVLMTIILCLIAHDHDDFDGGYGF